MNKKIPFLFFLKKVRPKKATRSIDINYLIIAKKSLKNEVIDKFDF